MTAIMPSEIRRGIVILLNLGLIRSHARCRAWLPGWSRHWGIGEPHPCVCVRVHDDHSLWCPLTTKPHWNRMGIDAEWRNGLPRFNATQSYLVSGANLLLAPWDVVVAANADEATRPDGRNYITETGMEAIDREIERQKPYRVEFVEEVPA